MSKKKEDYRLGDYVHVTYKTFIKGECDIRIESISKSHINGEIRECISPITLTNELLEKITCKQITDNIYKICLDGDFSCITLEKENDYYLAEIEGVDGIKYRLKYLNEFQHLLSEYSNVEIEL